MKGLNEMVQRATHSVYFLDSSGRLIGEPMLVREGESARPPAYQPPPGYVFLYWSCSTSCVTEDTFCVALTQQKERWEHTVTFYDNAGQVLDSRTAVADAFPPDFTPPEGFRLTGWDILFDANSGEGVDLFIPRGNPLPRIMQNCRAYPRCEATACRLFVIDLRATNPKLLPLGRFGYGALITQEDLACLHLRNRQSLLHPFRFTIEDDLILALTRQGVCAFGMDMQPVEMHAMRLMPSCEPVPQATQLVITDENVRVSA